MEKETYNPGPRLTEKEIEELVKDLYVDGKSPMEWFGIDWAESEGLSKKLEVHSVEVDVPTRTLKLHISNLPRVVPFTTKIVH